MNNGEVPGPLIILRNFVKYVAHLLSKKWYYL